MPSCWISPRLQEAEEENTEVGTFPQPWMMGMDTRHFSSITCTAGKGQTQLEELKTQYKASPAWF